MPKQVLEETFGVVLNDAGPGADYNITPGSMVLAVMLEQGHRVLRGLTWGLIPPWDRNAARGGFINARSETAFDKPSFRTAMGRKRCLVPASLFYEWQKTPGRKLPFAIALKKMEPMALAAIHAEHEAFGPTLAILTTAPNMLLAPIHNRMPLILPPEAHAAWLDPATPRTALEPLLLPYPASAMDIWPITSQVNNPQAHGPEVAARLRAQPGLLEENETSKNNQ